MARNLEFNPELALDKVMELFWQQGVEHTSISDIVTATGVQRSGLYNVFGSKEELYKKAINRYMNHMAQGVFADIFAEHADFTNIVEFFNRFKQLAQSPIAIRGCFMCNTASSDAKEAHYVSQLIQERFKLLEERFYQAFKRGRFLDQFDDPASDRQLAQYCVGSILSISNLCRTDIGRSLTDSYLAEIWQRFTQLANNAQVKKS